MKWKSTQRETASTFQNQINSTSSSANRANQAKQAVATEAQYILIKKESDKKIIFHSYMTASTFQNLINSTACFANKYYL